MSKTLTLLMALAVMGVVLCAGAGPEQKRQGAPVAETQHAEHRGYDKGSQYKKGYEGPEDHHEGYGRYKDGHYKDGPGYEVHGDPDRPSYYPDHYDSEPELSFNELTPSGNWPRHLKLRLFATPVGHKMDMPMAAGATPADDFERHAPLLKMYDAWCEVPHDPEAGEAVPVPHLGHLHVTYKPAHHQKPWRLWGQTALNIGKISKFELAHLDDDNDTSICATFFNAATVITPINDPPIYNMLIKPHYPVNMQYVLDGMRAWPIPNDTRADGGAAKARAMGVNGEDAAYGKGGEYGGKEVVYRHVVEEAAECRIAQVIWGALDITTVVDGVTLHYKGTLKAIPDLDMTGVGMPMVMRSGSSSETSKIMQAMCGDKVVEEAVPWTWEFDLFRV